MPNARPQCSGLLLAVTLALAASAASAQSPEPMSAPELASVTRQAQQFVDENRAAGVVTLVAHRGKVVHLSAVGQASIEAEQPMTEDSLFAIASMTKPITATALMILVDEGKVSIGDPVEKHIPAFADAKLQDGSPVTGLTIRHLLTHSSGLTRSQDCEDSLEATANRLAERPFAFAPGEKWEYSPGLNVCGRIIEVVSGMPYQDFLSERIFRPLGMTDTTFFPTPEQAPRMTALYARGDEPDTLKAVDRPAWSSGKRGSVPNPSGGLYATAHDMSRFYQAILNGGQLDGVRIVTAESVQTMTTRQSGDLRTGFTPGNTWGLGWCVVQEPQGVTGMLSPGTYGHGGAFGTQGWVDPQRQTIVVLMIQRSDLPNSDGSRMRQEFQQAAVDAIGGT